MVNTRSSQKLAAANPGGPNAQANGSAQVTIDQPAHAVVCEDTARGAVADRAPLSRRESTESNGALSTNIFTEDKPTSNGPRSADEANKENSTPLGTGHERCHPAAHGIAEAAFQPSDQNPVPSQNASSSGSGRAATSSTPPALKKPARKPGQKGRRKPVKGKATTKSNSAKCAAAVRDTGKANDNTGSPSLEGLRNKYAGTSIEDDAADLLVISAAAVLAGFRASGTRFRGQTDEPARSNNLGPMHGTVDPSYAATAAVVPLRRSGRERKLTLKAKEAADMAESKAKGKSEKVHKANGRQTTAGKKRKHGEVNIDGDGPAQSKHGRVEPENLEGYTQGAASDLRPQQPTPPAITTGWIVADASIHRHIQTSALRVTSQGDNRTEPSEDRPLTHSAY